MDWEKLTEAECDGYFCREKDAVVVVNAGSLCELKSIMRIHAWAITQTVTKFLEKEFEIKHIPYYGWLAELLALIKLKDTEPLHDEICAEGMS